MDSLFNHKEGEQAGDVGKAGAMKAAEAQMESSFGKVKENSMQRSLCGAPSIQTWAWVALRPGLYVVRGEYKRAWEETCAPLKEVEFAVKVE